MEKIKEIEMLKERVKNYFVDCQFAIEEKHLPEINKLKVLSNYWENKLVVGDLFVDVDIVEGLPKLNITNQPEKNNTKLVIENFGLAICGRFFFEPNNQVWYEEEQANAEYENDLYQVAFTVCKFFNDIDFSGEIYKVK